MKNINVVYDRSGKINSVSDTSMYFEQENDALQIDAQIPADEGKLVRAYIKASKNSDVVDVQSTSENLYSVTIGNECMSKGTMYVGFEVYDESGYVERYEPLKVYIDGFINLGNSSSENVYVVTVDVAETETLEPDVPACVENIGTQKDMRLKLGIPRGKDGEPGYSPIKGKDYFTAEEQQGFKADILAEINPVLETKASARTQKGGFNAGDGAVAAAGAAVGGGAQAGFGGAVGRNSYTDVGGAVGLNAKANAGGAMGWNAKAGTGFSGGSNAIVDKDAEENYIDAIQLGMGTNTNPKTLQIYNHTLMNADGTIPEERLTKAKAYTEDMIDQSLETVKLFDNQVLADSKAYTDEKMGDIETALDTIIAMQNELTGGVEV